MPVTTSLVVEMVSGYVSKVEDLLMDQMWGCEKKESKMIGYKKKVGKSKQMDSLLVSLKGTQQPDFSLQISDLCKTTNLVIFCRD